MKLNLSLNLINKLANRFDYWNWSKELVKEFANSDMDMVKKFLENDAQIIENQQIEMRVKRALSYRTRLKVKLGNEVCEDGKLATKMQEAGYTVHGEKMPELLSSFRFNARVKGLVNEVIIIRVDDLWPVSGWNGSAGPIIERAESFGLGYCSLELGLQFLLQHAKSLPEEYFTFAMDSIYDEYAGEGFYDRSYLGCRGTKIIPSCRGCWGEADLWAFRVVDSKKLNLS